MPFSKIVNFLIDFYCFTTLFYSTGILIVCVCVYPMEPLPCIPIACGPSLVIWLHERRIILSSHWSLWYITLSKLYCFNDHKLTITDKDILHYSFIRILTIFKKHLNYIYLFIECWGYLYVRAQYKWEIGKLVADNALLLSCGAWESNPCYSHRNKCLYLSSHFADLCFWLFLNLCYYVQYFNDLINFQMKISFVLWILKALWLGFWAFNLFMWQVFLLFLMLILTICILLLLKPH